MKWRGVRTLNIHLPAFLKRDKEDSPKCKYAEIPFEHLAPLDTANDSEVFKALDYALSQDCIHNIAVTGNYGSGKSSVLNTYIRKRKKHKFLNISLATFAEEIAEQEDSSNQGEKPVSEQTIQKIEKSILQQIFYSTSASKLPDSSFHRIHKNSFIKKIGFEFLILCFLVPLLLIFQNSTVSTMWNCMRDISIHIQNKSISVTSNHLVLFLASWFAIIAALIILYFIISFFFKMRFIKFSFQEIEFGLDSVKEESLLNRYVDEILYFFEKTKYNVVIIEDLDRFKNTEIFIKLRELNTLINHYEKIKKNVVFIYALKDEVFKDHSRTKFFEFIIPIIPVINTQNSCDILLKRKEENRESVLKDLSDDFLQDLGLYIDDMRILKNCINEFIFYDRKINATDYMVCGSKKEGSAGSNSKEYQVHNRDKLFALIVYKNLYPDDFAMLSQNKGILAEIFKRKQAIVQNELKTIENEIAELETKIQEVERQIDLDIGELRTIYIAKILESTNVYAKNEISTLIADAEFHKIKEKNSITLNDYNPNRYGNQIAKSKYNINFNIIEKNINPSLSYDEREEIIRKGKVSKISEIENQIANKRIFMNTYHTMSLAQLIAARIPVEKFTENVPDEKKDFIIFLLKNGYIDENYCDYISYFYEGAISTTDKQYLLLIKNHKPPSPDLQLTKIENIMKRIRSFEWNQISLLNYSLLTYLLEKKDPHIADFILALIQYKKEQNLPFLSGYKNYNPEHLKYLYGEVYKIVQYHSEQITPVFQNEDLDIKYYFFIFADIAANDKAVKAFLESDISFLHRKIDTDKAIIQNKLIVLSLAFKLQPDTVKYDIFDIVVKTNAYALTRENFDIMLRFYDKTLSFPVNDYYSRILALENQNIRAYVDANLQSFTEKTLMPLEKLSESEESLIYLLNAASISNDKKAAIVRKSTKSISDITAILLPESADAKNGDGTIVDLWNVLVQNQKIKPVWKNILEFFKHKKNVLDETLISFLNAEDIMDSLKKDNLQKEVNNKNEYSDIINALYSCILYSDDLTDKSYEKLMTVCPWAYNSLNKYSISAEKMMILIRAEALTMTSTNYNGIKSNHGNLLPLFVHLYFDDFLKEKDNLNIPKEDIKKFLESKDLNIEQKSTILSADFAVWKTMTAQDDLRFLAKKIIEIGLQDKTPVPLDSIINVVSDEKDVLNLLVLQGQSLDGDHIKTIINNKLGEMYKQCIAHTEEEYKLDDSAENKRFVELLKNKGLISSFSIKKGNIFVQ